MKAIKSLLCLPLVFALTACPEEGAETKKLLKQADTQIGMPGIVNFSERRLAKQILELRDKTPPTHTYIFNQMGGCLVYLGASMGYGLPYAVQYTNPQVYEYHADGGSQLPQADPNGLYMPAEAAATWVLIYNKASQKAEPMYVEQDVLVSTFRLTERECK